MKLHWKQNILVGIATVVLGAVLFFATSVMVDADCLTTTSPGTGCRMYRGVNAVVQSYTDLWRSMFARRCIGGNGPDDCIAPDMTVMIVTLFVIGFGVSEIIARRQKHGSTA